MAKTGSLRTVLKPQVSVPFVRSPLARLARSITPKGITSGGEAVDGRKVRGRRQRIRKSRPLRIPQGKLGTPGLFRAATTQMLFSCAIFGMRSETSAVSPKLSQDAPRGLGCAQANRRTTFLSKTEQYDRPFTITKTSIKLKARCGRNSLTSCFEWEEQLLHGSLRRRDRRFISRSSRNIPGSGGPRERRSK